MAKETDTHRTIIQIASSCLYDLSEDNSRLQQFVKWGIKGAKNWQMDLAHTVKTKLIIPTDYNAIKVPPDYIDWTKVGIKSGRIIKTFTRDNNIALHHDCEDGELIPNKEDEEHRLARDIFGLDTQDQIPFYGTDSIEPIYGLAYKDNGLGYFTEHEEKREIQFRTNLPKGTKILLEYVGEIWSPSAQTLIHAKAINLIEDFIHWQNMKFKRLASPGAVPQSLVDNLEREYWDEFDRTSWRMFSLTLEDVLEVQREAFVPTFQN